MYITASKETLPAYDEMVFCKTCSKELEAKVSIVCQRCQTAIYCTIQCLGQDWPRHREVECDQNKLEIELKRFSFEDFEESVLYYAKNSGTFLSKRVRRAVEITAYSKFNPQKALDFVLYQALSSCLVISFSTLKDIGLSADFTPEESVQLFKETLYHPPLRDPPPPYAASIGKYNSLLMDLQNKCDLSNKEYNDRVEHIANVLLSFIKTDRNPHAPLSIHDLPTDKVQQSVLLLNYWYEYSGMKQSKTPIAYSAQDLRAFDMEKTPVIDPKKMNCFQFVLLQSKVFESKDVIFQPRKNLLSQAVSLLVNFGYKNVKQPAQVGDILLYVADNTCFHAGLCTDCGFVLSKIGFANPYSHRHAIPDLFYEDDPTKDVQILIFRKASKS